MTAPTAVTPTTPARHLTTSAPRTVNTSVATLLESVCVVTGVGAAIVAAHCWALISSSAAAQLLNGENVLASWSSERLVTFLLASVIRVSCLSRVSCSKISSMYVGAWLQHAATALFVLLLTYEQLWHVTLTAVSISGFPLVVEMLRMACHLESTNSHFVIPWEVSSKKVMVDIETLPAETFMQRPFVRRAAWLVPLASLVLLQHVSRTWRGTSEASTPTHAAALVVIAAVDALCQSISAIRTLVPLVDEDKKTTVVCLPYHTEPMRVVDRVTHLLTQVFGSLSLAYSLGLVTLWTLVPALEELESLSSGDALRHARRWILLSVSVIIVVAILLLARQVNKTPEQIQDDDDELEMAATDLTNKEEREYSALWQDRLFICTASLLTIATMDWRVAALRALASSVSFSRPPSTLPKGKRVWWRILLSLFETLAPLLAFAIQCHYIDAPMAIDVFLCGTMQRGILSLMSPMVSSDEAKITATEDVV